MKNGTLFVLLTVLGGIFAPSANAQRAYGGGGGVYETPHGYVRGGGPRHIVRNEFGGGVVGLAEYAASRTARGPKPRDCSKKKPGDKKCDAALTEAQAQAELTERQLRGGSLRNATPFTLVVTDCDDDRVAVLQPGKKISALEARCGYEGTMLVPSQTPGLREDRSSATRVADDVNGWVFVAPRLPRQGGVR